MNAISSRIVKNRDVVEKYIDSIENADGSLKSTYEILLELKPAWDKMDDAERATFQTTVAGVNQGKIFAAVMSQMSVAQETYTQALNSSGYTMKQNEVYMDSLEAKTSLLKAEFEKLVIGDGGLQDFAKVLVDLGTKLLQFANSDAFKLGVVLSTIVLTITKLVKLLPLIESKIIKIGYAFLYASEAGTGLLGVLEYLSINPITLGITALIASIVALKAIYDKYNVTLEEHKKKLEEASSEYNNTKSEVENLTISLKDVKGKIEEINSLKLSVSNAEELNNLQKESSELEKQEKILKRQLAIALLKLETKRREAEAEAKATLGGTNTYKYTYMYGGKETTLTVDREETAIQRLESINTEYKKLKGQQLGLIALNDTLIDSDGKVKEGYEELYTEREGRISQITSKMQDLEVEGADLSDTISTATSALDGLNDSTGKADKNESLLISTGNNAIDTFNDLTGATEKVSVQTQELEEDEEKLEDTTKEEEKAFEKLKEAFDQSSTSLSKLKENFELLKTVGEEINKNGKLSVDTYESLMSLEPKYLQALFDENGALRDNIVSQEQLYKLKIDQMAIDQATQLLDLAENYKEEGKGLKELNSFLSTNNNLMWDSVYARLAKLELDKEEDGVGTTERIRNQIKRYQEWANQASKSVSTYATKASEKATKQITSDLEKQKNALTATKKELQATLDGLEEITDNYKKVFSYLSSRLDEEKDKLEKQKDKETDLIEKQINALKDQKDAEEDYWDEKINALKEQNEALEDQVEYEKLLDELAKAKSTKVKVYREGVGFVYETDASAVSKAQKSLDDYNTKRKYEEELALLEKSKEDKLKSYEEQIKNLENYKDAVEENYEEQIKIIENYKDSLEKQVDSYETEQNRLLTLQMVGIDTEQGNWMTRLGNLDSFVSAYNSKLAQIESVKNQISEIEKQENALDIEINKAKASDTSDTEENNNTQQYIVEANGKEVARYDNKQQAYAHASQIEMDSRGSAKPTVTSSFASGVSSISGGQIAVVGEDPNKEIVLGSKANGLLTRIDNGGGVVNAKSTKTLAGILNQIGSYAMNSFSSPSLSSNSVSNNNSTTISIGNVSVQANNANEFVESMMQFKMEMTQKAFSV